MKTLERALLIVAGIWALFLCVGHGAECQRDHFGKAGGDVLWLPEVAAPIWICLGLYFWSRGSKRGSVAWFLFGAALLCAFLGWGVHPDQTLRRSRQRVSDWEAARQEFDRDWVRAEYPLPRWLHRRLPHRAGLRAYFDAELMARRLEHRAAELRYRGQRRLSRDGAFSSRWELWALGLLLLGAATVVSLRPEGADAHRSQVRDRGEPQGRGEPPPGAACWKTGG